MEGIGDYPGVVFPVERGRARTVAIQKELGQPGKIIGPPRRRTIRTPPDRKQFGLELFVKQAPARLPALPGSRILCGLICN